MSDDLVVFLRARLDEYAQSADRAPETMKSRVDAAKHGMWVLADVHSKRGILDQHERSDCRGHSRSFVPCGDACTYECVEDSQDYPCITIKLLALPYDNHPDYREEWRA